MARRREVSTIHGVVDCREAKSILRRRSGGLADEMLMSIGGDVGKGVTGYCIGRRVVVYPRPPCYPAGRTLFCARLVGRLVQTANDACDPRYRWAGLAALFSFSSLCTAALAHIVH